MPWPQTGATQYHAQFGLPDKDHTIKGLVVCYVVYEGMGLKTCASSARLVPSCGHVGYRAQIPQHPVET